MELTPQPEAQPAPAGSHVLLSRVQFLFLLYLGTCGTLLFRLACGAVLAMRLWRTGQAVTLRDDADSAHLAVRSSERISSPLTIGSGILLPADYAEWDAEKMRIVLAHEASHVRQRDFYLQLAAGLYAAIFWFLPLGWWLKRKLSDLSEAISDRAGLGEAGDAVSYAQILIEFAALPHNPQIGVAMARQGRLTQRIERLLNESSFQQAFTATRTRMAVALLCVPAALFTATTLVRVQAAAQAPQSPAPLPAPPVAPVAAQAAPAPPPVAPQSPAVAAPAPMTPPVVSAPALPPPSGKSTFHILTVLPPIPPIAVALNDSEPIVLGDLQTSGAAGTGIQIRNNNYSTYTHERDGEFYGLFERHGGNPHYAGTWTNGHIDAINKAQQLAHGDFLFYTNRDGKSYYIDDPESVLQVAALYDSMGSFARQQEAMAKAQEALARTQEKLAQQQLPASLPKPDLQKDLAGLSTAIANLQAQKQSTITPEQLADLQGKLGEMQAKLIQFQMGDQLSSIKMEKLDAELAKIGARQGAFGREQGELSREAERRMKSIIDQSLKNGKAKPVK